MQNPEGLTLLPLKTDLNTFTETVILNYKKYAEVGQRLTDLQDWVRQQGAVAAQ